jgi:hypothetical protein
MVWQSSKWLWRVVHPLMGIWIQLTKQLEMLAWKIKKENGEVHKL